MFGVDMKSSTLDEVPESLDRFVDSKKFSVESTVLLFGVVELFGGESNGLSVFH